MTPPLKGLNATTIAGMSNAAMNLVILMVENMSIDL